MYKGTHHIGAISLITLFILMDNPIYIVILSMELSILYFKGLLIKISTKRCISVSEACVFRECSGSVVECLTRDRGATGSTLTGVTALWSLSKTHLS